MKLIFLRTEKDFEHKKFRKFSSSPSLRIRSSVGSQNIKRFGFIVPKKVLAKATDRNKIKRRLKTLLQKNSDSIKNADILILPQAASLRVPYRKLEADLIHVLKLLNLWKS